MSKRTEKRKEKRREAVKSEEKLMWVVGGILVYF